MQNQKRGIHSNESINGAMWETNYGKSLEIWGVFSSNGKQLYVDFDSNPRPSELHRNLIK